MLVRSDCSTPFANLARAAAPRPGHGMERMPAELVATVLDFFRTHSKDGKDIATWSTGFVDWDGFREAKSVLANVLAFAACSRTTRAVATSDAVWAPHLRTMETQFSVETQVEDFKEDELVVPLPAPVNVPDGLTAWAREDLKTRFIRLDSRSGHNDPRDVSHVVFADGHDDAVSRFGWEGKWVDGEGVEYLCYPTTEAAREPHERSVLRRVCEFPFECCGRRFDDREALLSHFETYAHAVAHSPEEGWSCFVPAARYADPRLLDPAAYAAQSALERYKTTRGYYERVRADLEAVVDPRNWSFSDREALGRMVSYCESVIDRYAFLFSGSLWDEAVALCTREACAAAVLEMMMLDFNHGGLVTGPRTLLVEGIAKWALGCDYLDDDGYDIMRFFNAVTGHRFVDTVAVQLGEDFDRRDPDPDRFPSFNEAYPEP